MRKLFLSLLFVLLLVSQSFGFGMIGHQGWRLVANGTATAANTQLSLVATTAFTYLVGTDLSAYQTGKHYINIYNQSTGLLIAGGFCSATPPAGETLGAEKTTNGDNEAAVMTAGTIGNGTFTQSAEQARGGTKSGKFIANADGLDHGIYYPFPYVSDGKLYKVISAYAYLPAGQMSYVDLGDTGYGVAPFLHLTTTDTWLGITDKYYTSTSFTFGTFTYESCDTKYYYVDDWSIKQVTDPPATGLRITSTKGGATQSWTTTGSGAVNAAITYKIYYCGD